MSYPGQVVTKKGISMQSLHIAKIWNHLMKPKEVAFMGKIKCKRNPKAIWNSMTKEQQIKVRKLHEQQDIKPAMKQTITDAKITALDTQLRISSQPRRVMPRRKRERLPKNQHGGGTDEILW